MRAHGYFRLEAVRDLVCDDDGKVEGPREVPQLHAEADELGAAGGQAGASTAGSVILGAEVGGDRVEDDEADVAAGGLERDLERQDVVLGLNIAEGLEAENGI